MVLASICYVMGGEGLFGEDLILIHAPRILRLKILNPRTLYNFVFFCLFAIACAMSWDGEHVWGRPTHRIHRACRIGPLLSIQRHLISYNQLTYKRFKEHSNSKWNQVVHCWWNYTCKLHCCVDGGNSIWLPWTLHITRTVLAFIFSQAQGRQEQKQPQNGIK